MDKILLITGNTSGIGLEISQEFLREGYKIIALNKEDPSINCDNYKVDLGNKEVLLRVLSEIFHKYNKIDVVINNAGLGTYKSIEQLSIEEWERDFKVNVEAPFIISKYLAPKLTMSDDRTILNIGSRSGTEGFTDRSLYCATKFALRGFSLSAASEFEKLGIKLKLLTLGSTLTNFGNLTIQDKISLQKEGKKYLDPKFVAKKVFDICTDNTFEREYVLMP